MAGESNPAEERIVRAPKQSWLGSVPRSLLEVWCQRAGLLSWRNRQGELGATSELWCLKQVEKGDRELK